MPVFSITRSGDEVGTFVTEAEKISIGRSEENTIRIKLKSVSRSHAVVRKIGLDYHISDCESKNGVYVNGKKVDKCVLRDGDLIGIGNCSIHFST
ncbi:MAG: FHA domain-containing protein, partial [Chitinispirillaceae bacterium]